MILETDFNFEGSVFRVRGLSIGEMLSLTEGGLFTNITKPNRLFAEIGYRCIVDWDVVYDEDDHGRRLLDKHHQFIEIKKVYTENGIDTSDIPYRVAAFVGEFCYNKLSTLSEEEEAKYKGYVRFRYWFSEKKMRAKSLTYQCTTCVRDGHRSERVCGRSEEQIEAIRRSIEGAEDVVREKKRGPRKKRVKTTLSPPLPKPDQALLRIADFTFPECPVSWVDDPIKRWVDIFLYSAEHGLPLFDGGLLSQPQKAWEAMGTVKGESSFMENLLIDLNTPKK